MLYKNGVDLKIFNNFYETGSIPQKYLLDTLKYDCVFGTYFQGYFDEIRIYN